MPRNKIRELADGISKVDTQLDLIMNGIIPKERLHELEKRFAATGGGDHDSPAFKEVSTALQQGIDKAINDAHPSPSPKVTTEVARRR